MIIKTMKAVLLLVASASLNHAATPAMAQGVNKNSSSQSWVSSYGTVTKVGQNFTFKDSFGIGHNAKGVWPLNNGSGHKVLWPNNYCGKYFSNGSQSGC